jgi:hypothetical protein
MLSSLGVCTDATSVQPCRGVSHVGCRSEAIAVFGIVLFLLGGRWADFYAFAMVSLAVFVFHSRGWRGGGTGRRQLPA